MASVGGITAENAENLGDIEKQWAVKAYEHAEVYFKLLQDIPPKSLKLTRLDDELYKEFRKTFPDFDVLHVKKEELNGSNAVKEKWRNFIMPFEKRIAHYNFGTLLRLNASEDYSEENTYFVTRTQFYAIEVARNREGCNDSVYETHQASKQ